MSLFTTELGTYLGSVHESRHATQPNMYRNLASFHVIIVILEGWTLPLPAAKWDR